MRIIVTDANERAALAACRALVTAGHEVHVTADTPVSLAGVSRGVHAHRLRHDPLGYPAAYAREVASLARDTGGDLLLAVTDASVDALLQRQDLLPDTVALPFPSYRSYRLASDKASMLAYATSAGLGVPLSAVIEQPGDGIDIPPDWFPAVLKPHRSVVGSGAGAAKLTVSFVADRPSLEAVLASLPPPAFPVLVQRRVQGPGVGLFLLRWDGRIVAAFAHRRLREKPPAGGVSTYRESVAVDPDLLAAGTRLLDLLDWRGVAMIECKREESSGRYVFMELNGRLWGSLQLAIDAGINFPALLANCVAGQAMMPVGGYRLGVRSRWFWGDVDHFYLRLKGPPQAPDSRLEALREFVTIRPRRDREEIWRWRDPAPFFVETCRWLRALRH